MPVFAFALAMKAWQEHGDFPPLSLCVEWKEGPERVRPSLCSGQRFDSIYYVCTYLVRVSEAVHLLSYTYLLHVYRLFERY